MIVQSDDKLVFSCNLVVYCICPLCVWQCICSHATLKTELWSVSGI